MPTDVAMLRLLIWAIDCHHYGYSRHPTVTKASVTGYSDKKITNNIDG